MRSRIAAPALPVLALLIAIGGGMAAGRLGQLLQGATASDAAAERQMSGPFLRLCARITRSTPTALTAFPGLQIRVDGSDRTEPSCWMTGQMPDGGKIYVLFGGQQARVAAIVRIRPTRRAGESDRLLTAGISRHEATRLLGDYLRLIRAPRADLPSEAMLRYVADNGAGRAQWRWSYPVATFSPVAAASVSSRIETATIAIDAQDGALDYYWVHFMSRDQCPVGTLEHKGCRKESGRKAIESSSKTFQPSRFRAVTSLLQ